MRDRRVKDYINPVKIIKYTESLNVDCLLEVHESQTLFLAEHHYNLMKQKYCIMKKNDYIILDFGVEIQGGIRLTCQSLFDGVTPNSEIRVRFGESVSETCSDIGHKNSNNDYSPRDSIHTIPRWGSIEIGSTGFRFVRIDGLSDISFELKQIVASYVHIGREYLGDFQCNDESLNTIWQTGARTVYLNMQDYIWDGAKRDRIVWIGDMHPEFLTIRALFGDDKAIPKSLDLIKTYTDSKDWMNDIPGYSMWWAIIHHDYYMQNGNLSYLKDQEDYMISLTENLSTFINADGTNNMPADDTVEIPYTFIDWPSSSDQIAQGAGFHGLLTYYFIKIVNIFTFLGNNEKVNKYKKILDTLQQYKPDHNNNKQSAGLMVLAGLLDPKEANENLFKKDPTKDVSTFLGCYLLKARGESGDVKGTLDLIREYWGAMIKLGATTFWEDFNMEWVENAQPIDTFLSENDYDIHGDNGAYCYKGFRHSLCHGWASGPTSFLSDYVLGVKFLRPRGSEIEISPNLGDLKWAKGKYPTPYGVITLDHKMVKGNIITNIEIPKEIVVSYKNCTIDNIIKY